MRARDVKKKVRQGAPFLHKVPGDSGLLSRVALDETLEGLFSAFRLWRVGVIPIACRSAFALDCGASAEKV